MSAYEQGESTPFNSGAGAIDAPKGIFHTKGFQIILAVVLVLILAVSITCCVLLGVFHSHLMFLCSYAEFMSLIVLQGIVTIFVGYHAYHIYKFFAPSHEEEDRENYGKVEEEEDAEEYEDDNDIENSKPMKVIFFLAKFLALVISILAFLVLVSMTITGITIQQVSYVQTSGQLHLPGLKASTKVFREPNGMIHIKAATNRDMFFAQGVVTAQERMWQLEFHRRLASGTLSEILGSATVPVDKWSRTIGFYRAANRTISTLPADVLDYLNAFCDGINAYIRTGQHLAPEFSPLILNTKPQEWKPVDVLAFSKAISWELGLNVEMEVLRYKMLQRGISMERINQIYSLYPDDGPTVVSATDLNINATQQEIDELNKKFTDDSGAFIPRVVGKSISLESPFSTVHKVLGQFMGSRRASNNWVIHGSRTKSGKPLLANDPHLSFSAPGIWILMHLQSDEGYNVIGTVFTGAPGILIGRNEHIAWGVTNTAADVQDLYVMQDVVNGTTYNYKGATLPYSVTDEAIRVKDGADVTFQIRSSVYGPVINDIFNITGDSLCLWYAATSESVQDTTMIAFMNIAQSTNWQNFTSALASYTVPGQNFIYADKEGNIGYRATGQVPIRAVGHSGRYPVIGNGTWDHVGFIPFDKMPSVFNPVEGFIASANNKITPPGYPYSITLDWENQYRSSRIVELIKQNITFANFTVQDMKSIQLDVKSKIFEEYSFVFEHIKNNVSADAVEWVEKLASWDGFMSEGKEEPAVFEAWFDRMCQVTLPEIGERLYKRYPMFIRQVLKHEDPICQNYHNMSCTLYAAHAMNESITDIEGLYGGTAPSWGTDIHMAQFKHLVLGDTSLKCLASKDVYTVGGTETVNVADTVYPDLNTVEGVSYRQIIDLNRDVNDAATSDSFIIPLGQSGNWLSKLYDNFVWQWRAGEYAEMKFVGYNVAATLELVPQ